MRMGKDPAALPPTDETGPNLNPTPSWEVSRWRSSKSPVRSVSAGRGSKSRSPVRVRGLKPRPVSAQPNRWTPQPASRALRDGGGGGGGGGATAAERPGRPRSAMRRPAQKETSSNTQKGARVRSPSQPQRFPPVVFRTPSQPAS